MFGAVKRVLRAVDVPDLAAQVIFRIVLPANNSLDNAWEPFGEQFGNLEFGC